MPIPVPFTGKYTLVSSGNIDDALWYQGFFSSLEKILFENYMKYSTVDEVIKVKIQKETSVKTVEPEVIVDTINEVKKETLKTEKAIEEDKKEITEEEKKTTTEEKTVENTVTPETIKEVIQDKTTTVAPTPEVQ